MGGDKDADILTLTLPHTQCSPLRQASVCPSALPAHAGAGHLHDYIRGGLREPRQVDAGGRAAAQERGRQRRRDELEHARQRRRQLRHDRAAPLQRLALRRGRAAGRRAVQLLRVP